MCYLRAMDAGLAIEAPGPRRCRTVTQGLAYIEVVPLKDLDIIPVLTLAEAGEGLARAVPAPEEIDGQCAYEAGAVVPVPEGRAIL
jgi:hypothetical protein